MPLMTIILMAAVSAKTATFMGMPVSLTPADSAYDVLLRKGAKPNSSRLYSIPKEPYDAATGNTSLDQAKRRLTDALNNMTDIDIFFLKGVDRRLRMYLENGEAEIEIGKCPADGSISLLAISYPRSVDTPLEFGKISQMITTQNGRGPDKTSSDDHGLILDWKFPDGSMIRASYRNSDARGEGSIAPVTVSYLGTPKAVDCHLSFLQLK